MLGAQFDGEACVGGYGLGLVCGLVFGFHCFNHVAMIEAMAPYFILKSRLMTSSLKAGNSLSSIGYHSSHGW